jgi:phage-related protein
MLTCIVRTIELCRTPSGKCPVEEFLDSLPDRHAQKVTWVMRLVERINIVPQQYFKKLIGTEDLWEIRAQVAGNSYRVLGFFDNANLLILTNGFSKKEQKTSKREIELARQRKAKFLQRRKKV